MIDSVIPSDEIRRLIVLLVKPSKYDNQGYLIRFYKGVLPSNTLAAMYSLTVAAFQGSVLAGLECCVQVFDEVVWAQRVNPKQMVSRYLDGRTKVVVGLIGVQTNQFPRAADLAEDFRQAGATVVIGGFHVSGAMEALFYGIKDPGRPDLPLPKKMPQDIANLISRGVIICVGEAEELWQQILVDIVTGKPKDIYRCEERPQLTSAPIPQYPAGHFRDFATRIITLDSSRGCPFKCSFCTVINVQGRKLRWRDPQKVIQVIKVDCQKDKNSHLFFTDDNFCRNPRWEEILDQLIELKGQGYQIAFLVQIDVEAARIKCRDGKTKFIEKLAQAGCIQVFVGIETINPAVLRRIGKNQNDPERYKELADALHAVGISFHAAYIIGFDEDDYDGVMEAVEKIKEIGVDQASFFCLTPLPGSEDHLVKFMAREWMDPDWNKYDSFQPVTRHPTMTDRQWQRAYDDAWRRFYSRAQMAAALSRFSGSETYWRLLRNFVWYRNSALSEKIHPMICGFLRIRTWRSDRRHGYQSEKFLIWLGKEIGRYTAYFFGHCVREFFIFQRTHWLKRGHALNSFWVKYGQNKWRLILPWNWGWHIRMLPRAGIEAVLSFRWFFTLLGRIRSMRK